MEPGDIWGFYNIDSGCYDVRVCEDADVVEGTTCFGGEDFTVNGGETLRLEVNPRSFRLHQIR
jgi:hypothetical protein